MALSSSELGERRPVILMPEQMDAGRSSSGTLLPAVIEPRSMVVGLQPVSLSEQGVRPRLTTPSMEIRGR